MGRGENVNRSEEDEELAKDSAETRSVRLFLDGIHAQYAMHGSSEAFVRTFRHYPLEDLHDAERRFRAHACRCEVRVCDRYFAAVVRNAHEAGVARRSAERRRRCTEGRARRARVNAAQRVADLHAHPEHRLHEALDVLADTWLPDTREFVFDGQLARSWLHRAIAVIHAREPVAAADRIELHVRSWEASRPGTPAALCEAVHGVLRAVITEVRMAAGTQSPAAAVGATLRSSTRSTHDNKRPPPSPHLRI
jgi:hypothetical protein